MVAGGQGLGSGAEMVGMQEPWRKAGANGPKAWGRRHRHSGGDGTYAGGRHYKGGKQWERQTTEVRG